MQNLILSLEGQFPQIYSQNKLLNSGGNSLNLTQTTTSSSSHSSSASSLSTASTANSAATSEEILPNKLPLKRRLSEFRFGRDGGTLTVGGKKGVSNSVSTGTTFTTNPFAFDKFKDITTAFTVHLHDDGVSLDPGSIGPFPYNHPLIHQLLNAINTGSLPLELFITLFEQSQALPPQQQLFYDGCVVVGVVEWRQGMTLTIGNVGSSGTRQHVTAQWTRRINNANPQSAPLTVTSTPESHKVLLKPTPECWEYALAFMASLPDGAKYAKIMEDEEKLLEFERQLILINEPVVCLDPSPMVMYAMNALYFDHFKNRLFHQETIETCLTSCDKLDQTLMNLAALKPTRTAADRSDSLTSTILPSSAPTSPTSNPRYRKISLIESWQERERRRTTEPIYGIDHRRQFVKNRQPLPPSSFVPANWRPFKTIRYEREISGGTSHPGSLSKLYYCVNVFYAPPPTHPPIQLLLQVGTSPDTSTSGFLHHLHFQNLIDTETYLQNLRNLLLIENGNCNLKVITDISTTSAAGVGANTNGNNANVSSGPGTNASVSTSTSMRKPPIGPTVGQSTSPQTQAQAQAQSQNQTQNQIHQQTQQYQLTPHQILQLNQQRSNPQVNSTPTMNLNPANTSNFNPANTSNVNPAKQQPNNKPF